MTLGLKGCDQRRAASKPDNHSEPAELKYAYTEAQFDDGAVTLDSG